MVSIRYDCIMVEEIWRKQLAEEIRHLAAGQMTNDEFEERTYGLLKKSKDPALREIWEGAWGLYDDLHEHKLRGKYAVKKEHRHEIARWIVFLYSGFEYEWPVSKPVLSFLGDLIRSILWFAFLLVTGCIVLLADAAIVGGLSKLTSDRIIWPWILLFILILVLVMGPIIHFGPKLFWNYHYSRYKRKMRRYGNPDIWPFIRDEDFQCAKRQPKLLCGTKDGV